MKILTGKVIAKKNIKTATVLVVRDVSHPLYGKNIKKSKKYQVHDTVETKVGDTVKFAASAPISKTKRWKIIK